MTVIGHGPEKYAEGCVLMSSAGRRWRGIAAEVRSHRAGVIPPYVPTSTEIAVLVRGATVVTRRTGSYEQRIVGFPGTIGLCPVGVREDFARITTDIDEMLHVYLAPTPFATLSKHTSQNFDATSVRYEGGFKDPVLEHIAACILRELQCESFFGDILMATLADSLAVRLLSNYSTLSANPIRDGQRSKALDSRRLRRVLDYIDSNLTNQISAEALAGVASLSRFHFSRMFKAATGRSPSQYVGDRRLELAKSLLQLGASVAQVAYDCGFSSESNFARSFRRCTGVSPGQYRNSIRQSQRVAASREDSTQ